MQIRPAIGMHAIAASRICPGRYIAPQKTKGAKKLRYFILTPLVGDLIFVEGNRLKPFHIILMTD